MNSLVSIIIPTYNRASLISETLNSILSQNYSSWECIVVDDGSKDDTVKIVSEFCSKDNRFKVFKRPSFMKKGANACRNYGFEKAKGTYIQWFDSDDIMHPNKLGAKVNLLNKNLCDYAVCSGIEFIDNVSNVFSKWNKISSASPLLDHITGAISFHTNGPMFRKEFLDSKPLFNENLTRKQEWEFYTRILINSSNYLPIKDVLYYFRIHNDSINGKNEDKTLNSRIKANRLVFKNSIKNNFTKSEKTFLRKHFFNKYIFNLKLALKSKKIKPICSIILGLIECMNINLFLASISNLIKQPKILLNLFRSQKPNA